MFPRRKAFLEMKNLKKILEKIHLAICNVFLIPVHIYRKFISPYKGQSACRFRPTCSEYAIQAVKEWGIIIGLVMAVIRVIRCNPFSKGGEDPVPTRKEFFEKFRKKKTEIPDRLDTEPAVSDVKRKTGEENG